MTVEENKAVVKKFIERMSKGDTSALDELVTGNYVFHEMGAGRDINKEALKQGVANTLAAFPDNTTTIEDMIAEGDKVSLRTTVRGTQTGKYQNIAPTGKSVTFSRFVIHRLEDGKITETWRLADRLGLYQQLGALPPTEEIGKY